MSDIEDSHELLWDVASEIKIQSKEGDMLDKNQDTSDNPSDQKLVALVEMETETWYYQWIVIAKNLFPECH